MTRKRERGSVVGFIVVGVLLTVLVVGGLYTLKQRNFFGIGQKTDELAQESGDAASQKPDDATSSEKADSPSKDTAKPDKTSDAQGEAKPDTSKSDSSAAEPETAPADTKGQQAEAPASSTSHANELPATGPSDVILSLVGPAVLVGAFVAYRRSYQL
ncbi:MAG TPA: hypothetical protein VL362_01080 [Patescibacteria group bacterium]|nr:hypothetical protein [Patescibacteria group bacterium]